MKQQSMTSLQRLKNKLEKVEATLNKCRTSTIQDGWQTQRFAKKSRKWDYYAQEKMKLKQQIEDEEAKEVQQKTLDNFYCGNCMALC